jgi:hypothetical protein
MLLLAYVLTNTSIALPITETLSYHILYEMTAEVVILYGWLGYKLITRK